MKQFTDANERTWEIVVNVGSAKRVKDLAGVNLFAIYAEEAKRVFTDPELLVNVVYSLCKKQADDRGITDIQFGESMVGDALDRAANALLEEVADFFPKARREELRAQKEKADLMAQELHNEVMEKIQKLDVTTLVQSMKSPVSSESIPTSSPSEN